MSIFAEREFRCESRDNFKFKNISLFSRLKVAKLKHTDIQLYINGVNIKPTSQTNKWIIFDVESIRNHCRDVLGETVEENDLYRLENTFVYNSLKAMSYYTSLSHDILSKTIFSDELEIYFKVSSKYQIGSIDVTEEYVVSDIHKETYN
jgi:hypothetical protein